MAMRPCEKCKKNNWNYSFLDETREVTATCKCGNVVKWKAKPRKIITLKLLQNTKPVMAIFRNGKLVEPTKKDLKKAKQNIINLAYEKNII